MVEAMNPDKLQATKNSLEPTTRPREPNERGTRDTARPHYTEPASSPLTVSKKAADKGTMPGVVQNPALTPQSPDPPAPEDATAEERCAPDDRAIASSPNARSRLGACLGSGVRTHDQCPSKVRLTGRLGAKSWESWVRRQMYWQP